MSREVRGWVGHHGEYQESLQWGTFSSGECVGPGYAERTNVKGTPLKINIPNLGHCCSLKITFAYLFIAW